MSLFLVLRKTVYETIWHELLYHNIKIIHFSIHCYFSLTSFLILVQLLSWNTLFYYGTRNRLHFPCKFSESNFPGDFSVKNPDPKNPEENQSRICLPLISRPLIGINPKYLQLVMWPPLPRIGSLLTGTYLGTIG